MTSFFPMLTRSLFNIAPVARCLLLGVALCLSQSTPLNAQRARGELRIEVHDARGTPLSPVGELLSDGNQIHRSFQVPPDGIYVAQDLPFGVYHLTLQKDGFAPWSDIVEIRSEIPVRAEVTLDVAPLTTKVEVNDSETLVDPYTSTSQYFIGRQMIKENPPSQPGRDLADLVNDLPGWLYEANGVLHPRGSEYDVQYVMNGLPVTQNRSPSFAPPFEPDDVESMRVLTAGYPAEYGRKLGGVVEVSTEKDAPAGLHGQFEAAGGSFSTITGSAGLSYAWGKNSLYASASGLHTDRYLDPPVLQNFTNSGNAGNFTSSYERDFPIATACGSPFPMTRSAILFPIISFSSKPASGRTSPSPRQAANFTSSTVFRETCFSVCPPAFAIPLSRCLPIRCPPRSSSPRVAAIARAMRAPISPATTDATIGKLASMESSILFTKTCSTSSPIRHNSTLALNSNSAFPPTSGTLSPLSMPRIRSISATGISTPAFASIIMTSLFPKMPGAPRVAVSRFFLLPLTFSSTPPMTVSSRLPHSESPPCQFAEFDSVDPIVVRLPVEPASANYYEACVTKAIAGKFRLDANIFRRVSQFSRR